MENCMIIRTLIVDSRYWMQTRWLGAAYTDCASIAAEDNTVLSVAW
jgi:hypothetical protein